MRKRKPKGCFPTINANEDSMSSYLWTCTACGRTHPDTFTDARAAYERRIAKTGIYRYKSNRHLRLAKVR